MKGGSLSFNSLLCGPLDDSPSPATVAFMCGCSRRRSPTGRFAAFRPQSFFVEPSSLRIGSGASGGTSPMSGWTVAGPKGLMVTGPRPVAVLPAAAVAAAGTVGGMAPGAVDGDQRMAAGHRPPLQHLSAPQRRVDAREAAAEVPGAGPVQPLAHPCVRRRPPHAGQRAEVPRHHRIPAAPDLPAGPRQRRCPAGEHRGARHQAAGKADATRAARVGDAVEACADRPQHAGHRQMPSQGIPGHFPARLLPVCPQDGRSGAESPRKKFATPAQQTDNERKEFLAGIAEPGLERRDMVKDTQLVTLRVPRDLHRRLEAARARNGIKETWTATFIRSLRAGLEVWTDSPGHSSVAEDGPRVRLAFLCPRDLFLEIDRVHAAMRSRWPTMNLTDVAVGLLHMGVGDDGWGIHGPD